MHKVRVTYLFIWVRTWQRTFTDDDFENSIDQYCFLNDISFRLLCDKAQAKRTGSIRDLLSCQSISVKSKN